MMKLKFIVFLLLPLWLVSCSGGASGGGGVDEKTCLADLNGGTVAVLLGSFQDIEMSRMHPEFNYLRMNTVAETIAAVENGKADYGVLDEVLVLCTINEGRKVRELFPIPEIGGEAGMAFRKEETGLCALFNDFLADYKASDKYNDLGRRWFLENAKYAVMPEIELPSSGEPLRVGVINNFPFTFIKDGKWAGYEAEMMMEFCRYANRPIQFYSYDFSGLITALGTGKVDVATSFIFITEERQKTILFSDSYYFSPSSCFVASGDGVAREDGGFIEKVKKSFYDNVIVEDRWVLMVEGLWETLVISFFSILFGTFVGMLLCWMRMSGGRILTGTAKTVVELVRGIPILVFLMLMFYVVFASSHLTARWVAIIAFAINFGTYVSEMFRTGIEGVDKGQAEAGLAMGFGRVRTFCLFVLPQALRKIIPVYKGEAISLIKNTSIVGYIAIQDLTKVSDIVRSRTFDAFFPLIIVSILYFVLAWILSIFLDFISKKI